MERDTDEPNRSAPVVPDTAFAARSVSQAAPLVNPPVATIRIRLDFGYDGGDFAGWAIQPDLRTVQGELETALTRVLRVPTRVTVAGRTDAGVHARHQVAHLDIPLRNWQNLPGRSNRSHERALLDRLRAVLPQDLLVRSAVIVPPGYSARFSAGSRQYVYRIDDGERHDPLITNHVLRHRGLLDVAAMDAASRTLVGLHDFAAFCRPREGATTIRRLLVFAWRRPLSGPDTGLVVGTIRADAFCHNMVRALVGTVLKVGEGRHPATWPLEVLESRDRAEAAAVVAPHGLTLEQITYPPAPFAVERALHTRARRGEVGG
ncbi:MAG: tRNA pseudouridine(38-40) synthase TruA [Promicromonosporaceae bacterium]|nr:tRNA pseudouridine(38-40) synthase TruA [Promicromonosporaceae bacterium]